MDGVTTNNALADLLANGLTADWDGANLQLTATAFVPSRTTVPADVPAPTFSGYAVLPVVWDGPGIDPDTGAAVANGTATYQWVGPSDGTGQSIVGWALRQPGSMGPPLIPDLVLASGLFPVQPQLVGPTNRLTVAITVSSNGTVTLTLLP